MMTQVIQNRQVLSTAASTFEEGSLLAILEVCIHVIQVAQTFFFLFVCCVFTEFPSYAHVQCRPRLSIPPGPVQAVLRTYHSNFEDNELDVVVLAVLVHKKNMRGLMCIIWQCRSLMCGPSVYVLQLLFCNVLCIYQY
jgi:hypothetical protein